MSDHKINWRKKCSELEALLQKERVKVEYYQSMAQSSGRKSLQEISKLNRIIGERKRAEKALRESEKKYRDLVNNALVGVFRTNLNGAILFVNKAFCEMLKFDSAREMMSRDVLTIYKNPKDREFLIQRVNETGRITDFELELLTKAGKLKLVLVSAVLTGDTISGMVMDITEKKQKERALREKDKELEIKATSLEEVNTALRVLLEKREKDKRDLGEKILCHVKDLVFPYLEKLKSSSLDATQASCVAVVESNLTDIISPFAQRLSSKYLGLTPSEIRVAGLVKDGKSTKEIADFMHSSRRTVESHRDSIRKKLGIKNTKANLRTYLSSIR